ncbi:MAG: GtrA family protein [Steroidobacteraceae bacterium]|nr:GtrA family protein [Steroidobacteraceae bacterium]
MAQAGPIVSRELLSFAGIGAAAFFVDAGMLQLLLAGGAGLYVGRLGSWLCAATFTWFLNRRLTFRDADRRSPLRQWARFLAANSVGGLLNYGTYALCVALSDTARRWPVLAVGAGSAAGLVANFLLSRRLVFRSSP